MVSALLCLGLFSLIFAGTGQAQAFDLTSIPEGVNDALFGGNNLYMAKLLLSVMIIFACGLGLAIARLPLPAVVIVIFCVLGLLTGLGWLDVAILLIAVMVIVIMFSSKIVEIVTQGGDTGGK